MSVCGRPSAVLCTVSTRSSVVLVDDLLYMVDQFQNRIVALYP